LPLKDIVLFVVLILQEPGGCRATG